jgi:hypothetical protein
MKNRKYGYHFQLGGYKMENLSRINEKTEVKVELTEKLPMKVVIADLSHLAIFKSYKYTYTTSYENSVIPTNNDIKMEEYYEKSLPTKDDIELMDSYENPFIPTINEHII